MKFLSIFIKLRWCGGVISTSGMCNKSDTQLRFQVLFSILIKSGGGGRNNGALKSRAEPLSLKCRNFKNLSALVEV